VEVLIPEGTPEDDIEGKKGELEEEDAAADKLRVLAEDAKWPIEGAEEGDEGMLPWTFKLAGDTQKYTAADGDGEISYAAMVIRSMQWPGAVTVSQNGRYQNIYFGYGLKHGDVSYNPTSPPDVLDDPAGQPENPTPLDAPPDPLEPGTDKEGEAPAEGN